MPTSRSLTILAQRHSSTVSNRAFSGFGPQLGYLFPIGDKQGYLNVKGYREFPRKPTGVERPADLRHLECRTDIDGCANEASITK